MDIPPTDRPPEPTASRRKVTVHTDKGPRDVEVLMSGIIATVINLASPAPDARALDKKV